MLDKEELREREGETNIDGARDRKESEDMQGFGSTGLKTFFHFPFCAPTPSSNGFVLIRCLRLLYCFQPVSHRGYRSGQGGVQEAERFSVVQHTVVFKKLHKL